jgi:hypothetical protein
MVCGKQPKEARQRHEDLVNIYEKELRTELEALRNVRKEQDIPIDFRYEINTEAKWDFPALQYSHQPLEERSVLPPYSLKGLSLITHVGAQARAPH